MPERLELLEPADGEVRVGHEDRLGDLERQVRGLEAGLGERVVDVGDHVGVLELLRGEVDRHRERRVVRAQALQRARRAAPLAQDPAADRDDEPGLLGEGDEVARGDEPALGVAPAHERLDPGDRAVVEPHDRLVVQLELVVDERALQVGAQLEAGEHALVHPRLEQAVAALAVALGVVHRRVGVADELLGLDDGPRLGERDAHAGAQDELLVPDAQRHGHRLEHAVGGLDGLVGVADALEQHRELVAAEAGGGVAGADDALRAAWRTR